jgi:hypothetical protein
MLFEVIASAAGVMERGGKVLEAEGTSDRGPRRSYRTYGTSAVSCNVAALNNMGPVRAFPFISASDSSN